MAHADPDYVHQFDVLMTISELEEDQDFWLASLDVNLGPGLTDLLGWVPASGTYDHDGIPITPEKNHWQNGNLDAGTDSNDLRVILVEAAAAEAANRQYGEGGRPVPLPVGRASRRSSRRYAGE